MTSINAHHAGRKITVLEGVRGKYLAAGFPGWGAENYAEFLLPIRDIAGLSGTVTSVDSHGSNPWTRYTVRLANGGRLIGAVPGVDFDWA